MTAYRTGHPGLAIPGPKRVRDWTGAKRRLRQLGHLLAYPLAHFRYRALIGRYAAQGIMPGGWFQQHKYLGEYLSLAMPFAARRGAILSHYRFVQGAVSATALRAIGGEGLVLWRQQGDDHHLSVRLMTSRFAPLEGEWHLQFLAGRETLCTLTFLFAALPPFGRDGNVACLIGGVQGGLGQRDLIRSVAKANGEIAGPAMLMLAMRAVAQALGVATMYGVSTDAQVYGLYSASRMKADYDAMWAGEGATGVVAGFHALSPDRVERDLADVPRTHRRRTRLKRERKAEILAAIEAEARARLAA